MQQINIDHIMLEKGFLLFPKKAKTLLFIVLRFMYTQKPEYVLRSLFFNKANNKCSH